MTASPSIADAKHKFAAELAASLGRIGEFIEAARSLARDEAKAARGLNGLGASLNGLASTLDTAVTQLTDAHDEVRSWLAIDREPITEFVSETAVDDIRVARKDEGR